MREKLCFVGNLSSPFIYRDYEILRKHFEVTVLEPPKKMIEWLKYTMRLAKVIKKSDVVFAWFAGWHSALAIHYAKKYRKKSIVVVGGYDAAYLPELNYGAFTNLKEKIPAKYVYKNVDKVLVVDLSLKRNIIQNAKVNADNIVYVPTGYDPTYWKPSGEKENIVLTVVGAKNVKRIKLKGTDTFVKSAKYLPKIMFIVIGIEGEANEYLKNFASKNVKIINFLPQKDLLPFYQKAKIYCQLSRWEGLPNTLCEAMLCECIPVGTKVNGIKTAIGNTGFYVPYGDEKATAKAIKKALDSPQEFGKKARERIKNMFLLKKREERLLQIIHEVRK